MFTMIYILQNYSPINDDFEFDFSIEDFGGVVVNKSKFTYPKCPYCKKEYTEKTGSMEYNLLDLATKGWCKEAKVKCHSCGEYFKVKVHITYYGSKLD